MQDLQKWDAEKGRLEGRVAQLTKENKVMSAEFAKAVGDLKLAREEVERSKGELKRISALFPNLSEGGDVVQAIEDLKVGAATEFDKGFDNALEQLKVLYPEADIGKFDVDKIVVDGQIVDQVAPTSDVAPNIGENLSKNLWIWLLLTTF